MEGDIEGGRDNSKVQDISEYSKLLYHLYTGFTYLMQSTVARGFVVYLNFRAGSTFPVPVCTEPHEHWG